MVDRVNLCRYARRNEFKGPGRILVAVDVSRGLSLKLSRSRYRRIEIIKPRIVILRRAGHSVRHILLFKNGGHIKILIYKKSGSLRTIGRTRTKRQRAAVVADILNEK